MHYFHYRSGQLYCEDVPLSRIATEIGTPVYVYSQQTLQRHVRVFDEAFKTASHLICYAVKANSNLTILSRFAAWGTGFDIVSGGELFRVLKAGGAPSKVIFSGVGKTAEEIRFALDSDILFFNVESAGEVEIIRDVCHAAGKVARVSIRTNPDVDAHTHPYISTGTRMNKFGVAFDEARALYRMIRGLPELEAIGVSCHIGSQITEIGPFQQALGGLRDFVSSLRADGVALKYLDFGGGLGISYGMEDAPSPESYALAVIEGTRDLGLTLILEPGRVIVGNAGILLTRVLLRKSQGEKRFVVVDAGMNDLIRPALYGSFHQIWPVRESVESETADVVGPICESTDFLAQDRKIPLLERGDLMAVMTAGAYGFSLSSNYNSRPRVPELLVDGDSYAVIRRRETYDDLVRLEA